MIGCIAVRMMARFISSAMPVKWWPITSVVTGSCVLATALHVDDEHPMRIDAKRLPGIHQGHAGGLLDDRGTVNPLTAYEVLARVDRHTQASPADPGLSRVHRRGRTPPTRHAGQTRMLRSSNGFDSNRRHLHGLAGAIVTVEAAVARVKRSPDALEDPP